jgi:hypothetical protein
MMLRDFFMACAMGAAIAVSGCGPGGGGGGTGGSGGTGGAGGNITHRWYRTCGDPVCGTPSDDPNVPDCTTQLESEPCGTPDEVCETPNDDCNTNLICSDHDPKDEPGGCPISLAAAKHEITYLTDADRDRIRDEVVTMPLATWKYIREPRGEKEHLGFIIDDQPPSSPAVRPSGERVDLYGYTSMAVAAIQAQDREIEALRREVQSLRDELARTRPAAAACTDSSSTAISK